METDDPVNRNLVDDWLKLGREVDELKQRLEAKELYAEGLKAEVKHLRDEISRLKDGNFTPEELQNLCHNMRPEDLGKFRRGCEDYTSKLFGLKPPDSEGERLSLKARYDGQTTPCCECGEDYHQGDLVIDGHIYCPECRVKHEVRLPKPGGPADVK